MFIIIEYLDRKDMQVLDYGFAINKASWNRFKIDDYNNIIRVAIETFGLNM